MKRQFDLLETSPYGSDHFCEKIGNNYLNCSLIDRNIIDFDVFLVDEFKTLKGCYNYDSLPQEIKESFESCQNLFAFMKDHGNQNIFIDKEGLNIEVIKSGLRRRFKLILSSFEMTQMETKQTVQKLLRQNKELHAEIEKQNYETNTLLDSIYKEKDSKQQIRQSFVDESQQNNKDKKICIKIPKTKIIKKDREDVKCSKKHCEFPQKKVRKSCLIRQNEFQGKEYFKFCRDCFLKKQFLKSFQSK